MRSGACTVQQTLTTEAASVLKHSLTLARRRGHAQVTPLHVASTLLSSRTSVLKRACLKSQPQHSSHPLHSRALELCFNVALNRLPTSPNPTLHAQPSLSNALIAALKRAQAHQRRGCIESQQQQPLLTIKVELEQLIISILDDPSVSRVMREAGFSSTNVKSNIEDSTAVFHGGGGVFSSPCSPTEQNHTNFFPTHFLSYSSEQNPLFLSPQKNILIPDSAQDIKLVFQTFLSKKRKNTVIVGDSFSATEGLIAELMGKFEKGDVPLEMKHTQFIKFHFAPVALRFMKKEDVEMNVMDLKRKIDSVTLNGGGAMIYAGDLRWAVEESVMNSNYSPIDHIVSEIGQMIFNYNALNAKVWLVATASFQTYMRCQMRQPCLELQWSLQAVPVPSGGSSLGLSLHGSSVHNSSRIGFTPNLEINAKLSCCAECASNYEKEAENFKSNQQKLLPAWLQSNEHQKEELVELKRKWSRLCQSLHQQGNSAFYSNKSSWSNNHNGLWSGENQTRIFPDPIPSISFSKPHHGSNLVAKFRRQNSCNIEFSLRKEAEPNLDSLKNNTEGKDVKIDLALGNPQASEADALKKLLQENLPWQQDKIPSIVEVLTDESMKKGIWFLIEGNDAVGKRRLARAISSFADSLLILDAREEDQATSFSEKLIGELKKNEKLVVLVENVDTPANCSMKCLAEELFGESRKESIRNHPVFILTKSDPEIEEEKHDSVIQMTLKISEKTEKTSSKRKAEREIPNKNKTSKITKDFSLDLNIKAEEDVEETPMSSFLNSIPNRYVFTRNLAQESEMKKGFFAKMRRSTEEIIGVEFSVEERVLEEILGGCGSFVNSQFEKWLKDIFQTRLETVKKSGKGGIVEIKLSCGGKGETIMEDEGFMGSCLPNKIHLSFMD